MGLAGSKLLIDVQVIFLSLVRISLIVDVMIAD